MAYNFNELERTAASLKDAGRHHDALRIYLFMADGDPSLDGGYLGERIAECYERLEEPDAARYCLLGLSRKTRTPTAGQLRPANAWATYLSPTYAAQLTDCR